MKWTLRLCLNVCGIVAALGAFSICFGQGHWVQNGPTGGDVAAVVFDPTNPSRMFAGTSRGVYRSTNGGSAWTAINLGLPRGRVDSLAFAPSSPPILYAGVCSVMDPFSCIAGVVYRSADLGDTWTPTSLSLPVGQTGIHSLIVTPGQPLTLYAASEAAIYRSTDGGLMWALISSGLPLQTNDPAETRPASIYSLEIDPVTPSTLYAGILTKLAAGTSGVYRTDNGGGTWSRRSNSSLPRVIAEDIAIDATNPSTLYAATQELSVGGLYRSLDAGVNWTRVLGGIFRRVAIDPQNPLIVYAGHFGPGKSGVSRSDNGGATWADALDGLPVREAVESIAIHPAIPSTIYVGTGFESGNGAQGLYKTTDSGDNWTAVNNGINEQVITTLAVDPSNPSIVYAGGDGVFRSGDAGATWTRINNGLPSIDVRISAVALNPQTPSTLYVSTIQSGVYRSTDSGGTWTATGAGPSFSFALAVDPQNPATVYAGSPTTVFLSANGGDSWTQSSIAEGVGALAVNPQNSSVVYAGTNTGVYRSDDGGATWIRKSTGLFATDPNMNMGFPFDVPVNSLVIDPDNPSLIFAGTGGCVICIVRTGYGVYRSTNGGESWAPVNNGLSNPNITSLSIHSLTALAVYASTDNGAFRSMDGGNSWAPFDTGLHDRLVNALVVHSTDPSALYAGTDGYSTFRWQPDPPGLRKPRAQITSQ